MAPKPLAQRPLDLIYLVFFIIHLPVMFAVDLVGLYPPALVPAPLQAVRAYYIDAFGDPFFVAAPRYFRVFLWMEALFHVPVCLWAYRALPSDAPSVPIVLLVYAAQTAVTTITCIGDFWQDEGVGAETMQGLLSLYVPYLAVALVMGVDMCLRLRRAMTAEAAKKKTA